MDINLAELRRQSRIAAVLTALSALIVLGSLLLSYSQTVKAEARLAKIQADIATKQVKLEELQSSIAGLQKQHDALFSAISQTSAKSKTSFETLQKVVSAEPSLADQIPRVYMIAARSRGEETIQKASTSLRDAGFIVPAVEERGDPTANVHTYVRRFYEDEQSQEDAKKIKSALDQAGVPSEIQYVGPDPGNPLPPRRTYEFWLGKSPK
jgi:hypothetical protein